MINEIPFIKHVYRTTAKPEPGLVEYKCGNCKQRIKDQARDCVSDSVMFCHCGEYLKPIM